MSSAIENRNVRESRRTLSSSSFAHVLRTPGSEINYDNAVKRAYSSAHEVVSPIRRVSSAVYTSPFSQPYSLLTHPMYDQPSGRHYETFAPGGWASPIYQYMHSTDRRHFNPELPNRVQPSYRRLSQAYLHAARATNYHPASKSIDYYQTDLDRTVDSNRRWSLGVVSSHPYYKDYYGNSGLRHFAGYRPRNVQHYLRAVWIS
jgi:hypothetical protein